MILMMVTKLGGGGSNANCLQKSKQGSMPLASGNLNIVGMTTISQLIWLNKFV